MAELERVAITGLGIVSPIGNDLNEVASALRDGRSGIRAVPEWEGYEDLAPRVAGMVVGVDLSAAIPRKNRRSMGRVAQLCTFATRQAIEHAALPRELLGTGRVGLSVGSTTGSPAATIGFYKNILDTGIRANKSTAFLQVMGHTCAANVALAFGITGRVWGPNSACTSSSQGIGLAYDTLRMGLQDVMICGGAEEVHYTTAGTFDLVGAASKAFNDAPTQTPRPFDARRDGMVVGEGSGILILERWQHAVDRGATILAEIVGFATTCDGQHITSPAAAGMRSCMRTALDGAGLQPRDIDYVNAHATGTEAGDPTEAQASAEVFGDSVPVSSTKGQTGHTLGACGGIESIFTWLAMRDGFVPPTRNLTDIDAACQGPWLVTEPLTRPIRTAMTNNFAFGGINTSIILRRAPD